MPETVNQTEVQPLPAQEQVYYLNEKSDVQVKEQKPIKKKIWDPEDLVAKLAKQKNELSPKIKLLALVKVNSVNWLCAQIEDETVNTLWKILNLKGMVQRGRFLYEIS